MKTMLKKIAKSLKERVKRLFGKPIKEAVSIKPKQEEVYENIFLKLKNDPSLTVNSYDISLLRKRLKRYEHLQMRGSINAALALKQLRKQYRKIIRKVHKMESEAARLQRMGGAAEPKIFPMSGTAADVQPKPPGLSPSVDPSADGPLGKA